MSGLRPMAVPFVAAAPAGARVRTRLRVPPQDAAVLRAAGSHLGSLAGRDLAARCAEGRLDARGRAASRRDRKRALTAKSSSRWAGAITRASEDAWQLADRNLRAERSSLRARVARVEARLAIPAGQEAGRLRGYATPAERHAKVLRRDALRSRLASADQRLGAGTVSVARGGKALLRNRGNLAAAGLTQARWREEWQAARLFLTADGEKGKAWGNETIRWHPAGQWLELKLPAPLADLANRPHGRYRLSCPVQFTYRGDEVAAQAATGAIRYDARAEGRERHGSRPSRGRRGRAFRRLVSGIPTARFRDRLVQMTANAGLHVIVADPAYTSRWGAQHWLPLLREHHPKTTGHHAAAVVTGRRGLGHRARTRATRTRTAPEDAARPAQARTRNNPGSQDRTQEPRHPTRPPAATRHQDRQAPPDHGGQPGSPGPSGAAGISGLCPACSIRNGG